MPESYSDYLDLKGDGRIVLYKRANLKNPKWQVRISVPNSTGYKVKTTGTTDLDDAKRFALNLYDDLRITVMSGGSLNPKTFKDVFEEWEKSVTTMGPTRRGGSWDPTIHRIRTYALKFFGTMKIDEIGASEFGDFWVWRKLNYSIRAPSNATLKRERTSILTVFNFAVMRGYIQKVPSSDPPQSRSERRPTFSLEEWKRIYRSARKWVKEGEKLATWRDRFVAQQYFLILANTGLRVGELRDLQWGDIRTVKTDDGPRLIGEVRRGKTGSREVAFQSGTEDYIERLRDLRRNELGEEPPRDGLVICHRDGRPVATLKRSFRSLLKFADVPIEKDGLNRTVYSLRHFYATQRLSNETNPFLLAKQMGTSVEMLEKHYGQTVTSALAAQITKRT